MIVLSVGMEVSQAARELSPTLEVDTNAHDFVATSPFAPVTSSRGGIYVCGAMQGPKDIPESVMQASAAAGAVSAALGDVRWTETKTRQSPPNPKTSGRKTTPASGCLSATAASTSAASSTCPAWSEYAKTLPNVAYVEDNLFTCSQDTQVNMTKIIEEHNLNRVVVAACTPITHEPLFRETLIDAGLNKYLFEMANIRNQDSWVHMKEHDKATDKAKDLVRMAVARASLLKPLMEKPLTINQRALVIGGGIAGLNAALNLGDQGFETILLEKEPELGGIGRRIHKTIEGLDVQAYLDGLIERVKAHDKIQVLTGALVVGFSGYKGNFTTEVLVGPGMYERKIDHGITVVATGAHEYHPKEFLYGEHERVMTQLELGDFLHKAKAEAAKWDRVVMVQCVGSRNEENPNCSRICCQGAVKYALQLKEINPDMDVVILYRDMRTYGFLEDYYREARDKGVLFSRFDPDHLPQVNERQRPVERHLCGPRAGPPHQHGRGRGGVERRGPGQRYRGIGVAPENSPGTPAGFSSRPTPSCGRWILPRKASSSAAWPIPPSSSARASPRPWPRPPGPGRFWRTSTRPSAGSPPTWNRTAAPPAWCASGPAPTAFRRSTGITSRRSTRPCARAAAPAPRNVRPRSSRWPIMKTTRSAPRSKLYIEESDDGTV